MSDKTKLEQGITRAEEVNKKIKELIAETIENQEKIKQDLLLSSPVSLTEITVTLTFDNKEIPFTLEEFLQLLNRTEKDPWENTTRPEIRHDPKIDEHLREQLRE